MEAKEISALILEREQLRQQHLLLIAELVRLDALYRGARKPDKRAEYFAKLVEKQKLRDSIVKRKDFIDGFLGPEGYVSKGPVRPLEKRTEVGKRPMRQDTKRFLESLRRKPK